MTSRRSYLAYLGTGGLVATAGCLNARANPLEVRRPVEQAVEAELEIQGQTHEWTIAFARGEPGVGGKSLVIAEEFEHIAGYEANISVDDETAAHLADVFDTVRYRVNLCDDDSKCRQSETARKDLNRITWNSEVKASLVRRKWRVFSVETTDDSYKIEPDRRSEYSIKEDENWPEGKSI